MKVKLYGDLETVEEITLEVSSFKQLLSGIEYRLGPSVMEKLYTEKYFYFLYSEDLPEKFIPLNPDMTELELEQFDEVIIIPEISGEISAAVIAGLLSVKLAAASTLVKIGIYALTAVVNMSISFSVSAVVQALTPSPTFNGDPAKAQLATSSLFNGPLNIREQGGAVPIVVGNPFCGGVIIASSVTTE